MIPALFSQIDLMVGFGIMATSTHISLSEYLETSYRPDREYLNGEVRERNVGKFEHARIQALLAIWFGNHERDWGVIVMTEQRIQTSPSSVRIPDLAVVAAGPQPDVLTDAPLLVIEILSPADSYWDTQERARDYQEMGVQAVWIIDPKTRTGCMCFGDVWKQALRLEVSGTPLYVELNEIFGQIGPRS
jgi:Uma2 family endonuclease